MITVLSFKFPMVCFTNSITGFDGMEEKPKRVWKRIVKNNLKNLNVYILLLFFGDQIDGLAFKV